MIGSIEIKKHKISELAAEVGDMLVNRFLDFESEKLLDEKIKVLTELKIGKLPGEIFLHYDVLELMPNDGTHWD